MFLAVSICCAAVGLGVPASGQDRAQGVYSVDDRARALSMIAPADTSAVVLLFLATDCPISNRYQPEIARLDAEFHGKHVKFWNVYPNPGETAAGVEAHQKEFHQTVPALLDPKHLLVAFAGAGVTPEAAVFVPSPGGLHEVFRGRIDDRYASLGRQRPQASHHELADAINEILAGVPVRFAGGKAVGCAIMPLE